MTTTFDPYRKWLGIPPKCRPPNHYRLLGIELFESDADVISHAADQRAVHLKTFANGPNGPVAERLLNEVAAARVCLLNPGTKARYDEGLRESLGQETNETSAKPPPTTEAPPTAKAPPPTKTPPMAIAAPPVVVVSNSSPRRVARQRRSRRFLVFGIVLISSVLAVSAVIMHLPPAPSASPSTSRNGASHGKPRKSDGRGIGKRRDEPDKQHQPNDEPIAPPGSPTLADLMAAPDESTRPPRSSRDAGVGALGGKPVERVPPPEEDVAQKTELEIRAIYRDRLQSATTLETKRILAQQIKSAADETRDNSNQQFVLLSFAASLLIEAEELDLALSVVDQIEKIFAVDGRAMKVAMLTTATRSTRVTPILAQKLLASSQALAEKAQGDGHIGQAIALNEVALAAAVRLKDRALSATLRKTIDALKAVQPQEAAAVEAEKRIETEPDNAHANGVLGAWQCFVCDDWAAGLPRLAKSDDAEVASLSVRDLANSAAPNDQLAVADGWWERAKHYKGNEQNHISHRAVFWYRKALEGATGLDRQRILNSLESKRLSHTPRALRFDGKTSAVTIDTLRYDGSSPITLEVIVQPDGTSAARPRAVLGNLLDRTAGLQLVERRGDYGLCLMGAQFVEMVEASGGTAVRSRINGDWTHVAGVCDGQEIRLYVDGVKALRRPAAGPYKLSALPFILGAQYTTTNNKPVLTCFFAGLMRGVRISYIARYDRDFEPPQALTRDADTKVLFEFLEGRGEQLKDTSGNRHVGKIHGADWVGLPPELRLPATP